MNVTIEKDITRVIVLDVSNVYAQIHDQGYFDATAIKNIKQQYSDTKHWRVLVLD